MDWLLQFLGEVGYLRLAALGVIGIVGGVLSGLVGVGGGIVFVPGLVYAGGWEIKEVVAAALPIAVFGALCGTIPNASRDDQAT